MNTGKIAANSSLPTAVVAFLTIGTLLLIGSGEAQAATLQIGTIDLKTGIVSGKLPNNFITFVQSPVNEYSDSYYETVLKINFEPASKYIAAIFDVKYDAEPWGLSVNIGDSSTNNGHSGDGVTQSNDAEMQIGVNPDANIPPAQYNDLFVFGKDGSPNPTLKIIPDVVSKNQTISLTVANEYLAWNLPNGTASSLRSPYLYALKGQADQEGSVNYDIYAAFNRSIDGTYRPGSGVSQVRVSVIVPTPEPASTLSLLAFGILGTGSLLKRKAK